MIKRTLREESKLIDFLWESNAIENVTDDDSFAQALKAWQHLNKSKKLTIENILETHGIISKFSELPKDQKGKLRKIQIWIGEREGKSWYMLPEFMAQWIQKANESKTIEELWQDHIEFEHIHPFADFNGRMGRLIFLWQTIRNGLPIEIIYEKDKWEYYKIF